jgi:hypothetical protein
MRFDLILLAGIPLLALLLLGLNSVRERHWLLTGLWGFALVALAAGGLVFLVLSAHPASPAVLEPFSVAAGCFLVGGLVLRESLKSPAVAAGKPAAKGADILRLLAGAGAAFAVGAAAAILLLLSRAPAAALGLLAADAHPTIYALCGLGGLFVRYALLDTKDDVRLGVTVWHLALAVCGWFSVVHVIAAPPDGPLLPAMLLSFTAAAGIARVRPKRR